MLGSTEARAQPAFRMAHQGLIVAAVHVAGVLVLGAVLAAAAIADRPVADFTREPVRAMLRTSCDGATCSAIGFLSTLGLLAWVACATVCFIVAWAERDRPRGTSLTPVFLSASLLTLATRSRRRLRVARVPRLSDLALRGGADLCPLRHRRRWARARLQVVRHSHQLLAAAGGRGPARVSVAFDRYSPGGVLAEDGAKWLGTLSWTSYFVTAGLAVVDPGRRPGS